MSKTRARSRIASLIPVHPLVTGLILLGSLAHPAAALPPAPAEQGENRWWDGFHGPGVGRGNHDVIGGACVVHGELVVTGRFDRLGNQILPGMARFDGASWRPLGAGPGGSAGPCVVHDSDLYMLVDGTRVRRWDGTNWSTLVTFAPAGSALALAFHDGQLVVAGAFTGIDGVPASNIARWTGTRWEALGAGLGGGHGCVTGLTTFQGQLVATGSFVAADPELLQDLAAWDGRQWSALGTGVPGEITGIASHGDGLFVASRDGGYGFNPQAHLRRWNGAVWQSLDRSLPPNFFPDRLVSLGARLFICGVQTASFPLFAFGVEDFPQPFGVLQWNGTTVQPFAADVQGGPVLDVVAFQGRTAVVGSFVAVNGAATHGIAIEEAPGDWRPLTSGQGVDARWEDVLHPQAHPVAFADFRGEWIAGGNFTSAGGVPIAGVARWTGARWEPLGTGLDAGVSALATLGDRLVVAGGFRQAGGRPSNGIAVWDGTAWSSFGERFQGTVEALALYGGQLFAAGDFFYNGANQTPYVARWNGERWEATPYPPFGAVHDLVVYDGRLLAGGDFTWNGRRAIGSVAEWTGTEWVSFQDQPLYYVQRLRIVQGELYAVGSTTSSAPAQLWRWSVDHWATTGTPDGVTVRDVAWYNGALTAAVLWHEDVGSGGYREHGRLYRIQEPGWQPLSTQLDALIDVIAPFGGSLYCAGPFIAVAGKSALGVARWDGTPTAIAGERRDSGPEADLRTGLDPIPLARRGDRVQIAYRIGVPGEASLTVFDVRGRRVVSLRAEAPAPGRYTAGWNLEDRGGNAVPAGIYFVQLRSAGHDYVRRLVVAR